MSSIHIPEVKEILQTGMQFGHSSSRWNPKMAKYIYGAKNAIHIVDVVQTQKLLTDAALFVEQIAKTKEVVFIGSKKQAADIVQREATRAGAHFVIDRWPGGVFTNFNMVRRSLRKLQDLEKNFEEGVQGRTKYEVMQLKNEWKRLNRLYRGIKQMQNVPGAIFVVDPRYEHVAVKEAKLLGIPVIALADTNCDPDQIDYIVPGNDDAVKSIEMVVKVIADAVLSGNEGKGVAHSLKDYSDFQVEIVRPVLETEEVDVIEATTTSAVPDQPAILKVSSAKGPKTAKGKGILEQIRDDAQASESKASSKKKLPTKIKK